MKLTEEQWRFIEPYVPKIKVRKDRRGRPWKSNRDVLEGILWILKTGARWKDLPQGRYPPYQTCHRRFQSWVRLKVMEKILMALVEHLKKKGKIDLAETFIDASFVEAKKGVSKVGKTKSGKGSKIMAIVDNSSLPVALSVESASPHESQLVEGTLR